MIYTSKVSFITGASATTSDFPASNVLSQDATYWQGTGTLTLTFPEVTDVQLLFLSNVDFTRAAITAKRGAVTKWTGEWTRDDMTGQQDSLYGGCVYRLDRALIDSIQIAFTGTARVGYAWAGHRIDLDVSADALQTFDESSDFVTKTQGNLASADRRFQFRRFQFTTAFERYADLRYKMREVFDTGYGTPRPWIIDECGKDYTVEPESLLGILDGSQVGYDVSQVSARAGYLLTEGGSAIIGEDGTRITVGPSSLTQRKAQVTIGITEVYGGIDAS